MYEEHLLPPAARLLHIGPPKTGTTAVQSAFLQVRDVLPQHGVHYAGPGSRPKEAVAELTRRKGDPETSAWDDLVREVEAAGDLRVVISNERFSICDRDTAARAVAALGDERTHVVMVARPLDALLPSQWQQRVRKRRNMISYDAWLRIVLGDTPDGEHFEHFWVLHDLADQIERWSLAAAADRVTVIVSDESSREFLPRLFEGLVGLPEGQLVPSKSWSNRSLDRAEAELIRSLDQVAEARGWDRDLYDASLKPAISSDLRATPALNGAPILLPEWARQRVDELNEQRRDTLLTARVRVIGRPESLTERLTATSSTPDGDPEDVTIALETATRVVDTVIAHMTAREARLERRLRRQLERRLAKRVDNPPPQTAEPSPVRVAAGRLRRRLRRSTR